MSIEKTLDKDDARLAEGVAYFEQMLELMPDDRETLEFLLVAYNQQGETAKEEKILVTLAKILVRDRDIESLKVILPRLETCADPAAKALALKASMLSAPAPDLTPEKPRELTEAEIQAQNAKKAVESELKLVDILVEGGVLAAEDSANVRAQLEATASANGIFLISALQILEKENLPLAEKAIAYLADRCGTPPVPIAAFDPPRETVAKFPENVRRLRGAIPFGKVAKTLLAVVLDPLDEELAESLAAAAGGPVRRYLALPSEVESVLEKQRS